MAQSNPQKINCLRIITALHVIPSIKKYKHMILIYNFNSLKQNFKYTILIGQFWMCRCCRWWSDSLSCCVGGLSVKRCWAITSSSTMSSFCSTRQERRSRGCYLRMLQRVLVWPVFFGGGGWLKLRNNFVSAQLRAAVFPAGWISIKALAGLQNQFSFFSLRMGGGGGITESTSLRGNRARLKNMQRVDNRSKFSGNTFSGLVWSFSSFAHSSFEGAEYPHTSLSHEKKTPFSIMQTFQWHIFLRLRITSRGGSWEVCPGYAPGSYVWVWAVSFEAKGTQDRKNEHR